MSAKHTKGPWMAAKNDFGTWEVGLSEAVPESGGGVSGCGDDGEYLRITVAGNKEEHDARLIAAAPDLLEALVAEERHQWAMRNLESVSDPLDERLLGLRMEVEKTASEANMLRKAAIAKATGKEPA